MTNPCTPEQAAATSLAIRKGMGQDIPDSLAQESMPIAGQITYAKHTGTTLNHMVTDVIDHDTYLPESFLGKQMRKIGMADSWITENLDPQNYLGRNYTAPLLDALQAHKETAPNMPKGSQADPMAVKRMEFDREVVPVINRLHSLIQTRFDGDNARINYANQWLDYWRDGGSLYPESTKRGFIQQGMDNLVGNLISGNPFIAVAHTMQIAPKAVAIYGPEATLKGIGSWVKSVGDAKTLNLPDLIQKGALHTPAEAGKNPFKHWDNIVSLGDNIARGLSYHIAEAHTAGRGMEGVHNIAYAWQPGREPMVLWNKQSATQVALQRYAISGAKMYGGWIKNIYDGARTGDTGLLIRGGTALASFSVIQSLFTGVKSTIPAPVWGLLSQDVKDQVNEIDQAMPHVTKIFGRDMGEHYQPLGAMGIGLVSQIFNEDMKQGYHDSQNVRDDFSNADYARAGVDMAKAGLIYAQPFIPGARLTYKKLWDAVTPAILGDEDWSDTGEHVAKKLGFPAAGSG